MSDSVYIHMKIGIQYSCKSLGEFLRGLHTCDPFLEVWILTACIWIIGILFGGKKKKKKCYLVNFPEVIVCLFLVYTIRPNSVRLKYNIHILIHS